MVITNTCNVIISIRLVACLEKVSVRAWQRRYGKAISEILNVIALSIYLASTGIYTKKSLWSTFPMSFRVQYCLKCLIGNSEFMTKIIIECENVL